MSGREFSYHILRQDILAASRRCGNGGPLVQLCMLSQKGLVSASCTKGTFDGTFDSYRLKQRKIAKKTFSMTSIEQARSYEEEKEKGRRNDKLFTKMP